MLLSIFGIILTAALLVRGVTGALLIGILVTTVAGIPIDVTNYSGIMSAPPSIVTMWMPVMPPRQRTEQPPIPVR